MPPCSFLTIRPRVTTQWNGVPSYRQFFFVIAFFEGRKSRELRRLCVKLRFFVHVFCLRRCNKAATAAMPHSPWWLNPERLSSGSCCLLCPHQKVFERPSLPVPAADAVRTSPLLSCNALESRSAVRMASQCVIGPIMPSHFPACWVKFSLVTWPVPAGLTAMIKKNENDGTKFGSFFFITTGHAGPE